MPTVEHLNSNCYFDFRPMRNLHMKHHCIPVTSANVERVSVLLAILRLLDEIDLVNASLKLLVGLA